MSADISAIFDSHDGLGIGALVRAGEVTALEIIDEAIRRAEAVNPALNFMTTEAYEEGRRMARDPALPDGPFKGVPWLVKEIATPWEGQPLTNSCPYFKDVVATFDSEIVRRTKRAGFVLLGKSTAPELGWALSTESRLYGATRNPWDTERTPGGSSGGSAAAVAARVLPLAEATDGGGSIRVPAAHSGLVGLKPARGRMTMAPAAADFWFGGVTFFCLSRSVRDAAAYLDATGGPLPGDPYFAHMPARPYLEEVGAAPGALRIAVVDRAPDGCTEVDPEVKAGVAATATLLEELGHSVEPQPVPYDFWALYDNYTRVSAVQTTAWLEGSEGLVGRPLVRGDVEPLYWTQMHKGRGITGVQHANDVESLRMMCRDVVAKMAAYDVWLMPVTPMVPRKLGYYDMSLDVDTYDATRMGPDCAFTAPFNATGLPAISLPLHWTRAGLPVGMQFVGRDVDEAGLLRLAAQLEEARPWRDRIPPVHA